MKIIDIVEDLTVLTVVHAVSETKDWKVKSEISGVQVITIPFLRLYENGVLSPDSIEVAVTDRGSANEQVYWWKSIPAPFREIPEPEEQRQPYYNITTYIEGVEQEYPGWKVLALSVDIQNGFDRLNITAINPLTDMIVYRHLLVWMEESIPKWKMVEENQQQI